MTTKSTPSVSDHRRAELERQIRKRVSLEKKAFEYVKHLSLTDSVTEEELKDIGQHITKEDYADVNEERSIEKICGYPICPNTLKDVLKQKYKISVKNSAVYDLSERKKFCSNHCYEASKHFHQQVSETPVWLRDTKSPVQFTLLHREETQNVFPKGESVLESPWHKVKEELELMELEDKIRTKPGDISEKQNGASVNLNKSEKEPSLPGSDSGKTILPPDDQTFTAARQTVKKKSATSVGTQPLLSLSEKVKCIREWRTRQTVEFFRPDVTQVSDYQEKAVESGDGKTKETDEEGDIRLAPVDSFSQHIQRRRIVMQKLSHTWEQLSTLLQLDLKDYVDDMKILIYTFEFSNKNILFNVMEWLIVGYILLRILDEKKKFLGNARINLKQHSITEEEICTIVEYMTSESSEMEMVD